IPHALGGFSRGLLVRRVEGDENLFAGAHFGDVVAERAQRREDGLALRVADLGPRPHEDARDESHESSFPTMRLYASRYRSIMPASCERLMFWSWPDSASWPA